MNLAKPKRQIALVIVLFLHGIVFLGGLCALGIAGTIASLSPDSELNRLHRAPGPDELARSEIWFSGHIKELTPGRTSAGVRRGNDPWQGCSIRRQSYRSGKNAGWYDEGLIFSFGAALVVSDETSTEGRSVEIPFLHLGVGERTILSDSEATAMLPEAEVGQSSHHWIRDCFRTGWAVTVDGRSTDGMLEPVSGRLAARLETREARVSRLDYEAMWSSLGPLGYAGGLAWLALFLSILRTPGHLSNMFGAAFSSALRGSSLAIAMPFVGLGLGVVSYLVLFHSMAPLVIYVPAFAAFGLLIRSQARGVALRRRLLAVLTGAEVFGVAAAWGKIGLPDGVADRASLPVIATEVFTVSSKGALGKKVHTHVDPDPFVVEGGESTSTCDGSSSDFYGECRQGNEGGHDVRESVYGGAGLTNNRYAVRVTTLGEDDEVVIVGPVAKGADSRTTAADEHEGYRGSGIARFFRRDLAARVVVFQGTREELRSYVQKDLATLRIYRVLLGLWFVSALSTLALAAKYTLF